MQLGQTPRPRLMRKLAVRNAEPALLRQVIIQNDDTMPKCSDEKNPCQRRIKFVAHGMVQRCRRQLPVVSRARRPHHVLQHLFRVTPHRILCEAQAQGGARRLHGGEHVKAVRTGLRHGSGVDLTGDDAQSRERRQARAGRIASVPSNQSERKEKATGTVLCRASRHISLSGIRGIRLYINDGRLDANERLQRRFDSTGLLCIT